jgi:hypothetical protein
MVAIPNVSTASCCLNSLKMRALCDLALTSIKIGPSADSLLSKWGTTRALGTLSGYATNVILEEWWRFPQQKRLRRLVRGMNRRVREL